MFEGNTVMVCELLGWRMTLYVVESYKCFTALL